MASRNENENVEDANNTVDEVTHAESEEAIPAVVPGATPAKGPGLKKRSKNAHQNKQEDADAAMVPGIKEATGRGLGKNSNPGKAGGLEENKPGAKRTSGPGLRKNNKANRDSSEAKGRAQSTTATDLNDGASREDQGSTHPVSGAKLATGPGLRKNNKNNGLSTERKSNSHNTFQEATASSMKEATGRGLRNTADKIRAKQQQAAEADSPPQPATATTVSTTKGFERGIAQTNRYREAKAQASGNNNPTENRGLQEDQPQVQTQDPNVVDPNEDRSENPNQQIDGVEQDTESHGFTDIETPSHPRHPPLSITDGVSSNSGVAHASLVTENSQTNLIQAQQAGAPGSDVQQRQMVTYNPSAAANALEQGTEGHELTDIETPSHSRHQLLSVTGVSNSGLAHARPVTEDSQPNLMQAQQVDPAELERKATEKRKNKECLSIGFCISVVAIGVAVLLGIIFGSSKDAKEPALTTHPSMAPTGSPSSSPSAALDALYSILPNHTKEYLSDLSSPQSKAFDWLSGHHNISHLPEWRKKQLFALATFYYAMDGENWPTEFTYTWLKQERKECDWQSNEFGKMQSNGTYLQAEFLEWWEKPYQMEPCNNEGRIQNLFLLLDLTISEATPIIPPELALLTSLSILALPENEINAPLAEFLPPELHLITSLQSVALHYNSFFGALPSEIGLMTSLTELSLYDNSCSGALPSEMGLMTSLKGLSLGFNSITGALPSEMGLMTSLKVLGLGGNSFSGALPSEMGLMTSLTSMHLGSNSFSGALPSEMGLMTSLKELTLEENSFAGALPSEMGLMTNLTELSLYANSFSGGFPSKMGLMTNLASLSLGINSFSGGLPSEMGLMTSLAVLGLGGNSFSGALPSEMGLMTILTRLYLGSNSFSGALPSEMGLMTSLTWLDLSSNSFSGVLPSQMGLIYSLFLLSLNSNSFSGAIPSEMGLMIRLALLYLDNNRFSGTIPLLLEDLATNASLMELDIRNTSLTGTVPESLCINSWNFGGLHFDCSERLCGCCWCACRGSNYTEKCTVTRPVSFNPSEDAEAWPGSFPPSANQSNALTINVRTDDYPGETRVEWSIRNESCLWVVLQAQNTTNASSLYSYTQHVEWDTLYRLQIFDTYGDGICCSNGFGWLTITNSNLSNDFADGSVVWEARGDVVESSLEILIWVDSNGNAQALSSVPCPSKEDEEWPGAFPPLAYQSDAVTINVRTDDLFPKLTRMEWSIRNESDLWQTLDAQIPTNASSLHSYTQVVDSNAFYRLQLSDGYGKGTCCNYGFGWFTITNSTPSNEFVDGSIVWEARGDVLQSSSFSLIDPETWEEITLDVFIWVDPNGHTQVIDYLPEKEEPGSIQGQAMGHDNSTLVPLSEGENSTSNGLDALSGHSVFGWRAAVALVHAWMLVAGQEGNSAIDSGCHSFCVKGIIDIFSPTW